MMIAYYRRQIVFVLFPAESGIYGCPIVIVAEQGWEGGVMRRSVISRAVLPVLLGVIFLFFPAPLAHAIPIPALFNTGVDNTSALLAGGSIDPHYSLISSADPAFPGPNAIVASPIAVGFWQPNSLTSQWIAPTANQDAFDGPAHPAGNYTYRLTFDLTGLDPNTAQISGSWAVDDSGAIFLNGINTTNPSSLFVLTPFVIGSGFVSGINTLDFVVTNGPPPPSEVNPTGLRVEGISGAADPISPVAEPATLLLLASGLVGIGVGARRRRRPK